MSLILNALRANKEAKNQGQKSTHGFRMAKTSVSSIVFNKRALVLAGLLVVLAGYKLGASFFKDAAPPVQPKSPTNAAIAPTPANIANKARPLFEADKLDESLKIVQDGLKQFADSALLQNDIGMVFLKLKLYEESEKHLQMAIELDPQCAECLNNMGYLKTLIGEGEPAEMYLKKALALKTDYPDPYFNLGVLYEKNGDIGNATTAYLDFLQKSTEKTSPIYLQTEQHLHRLMEK